MPWKWFRDWVCTFQQNHISNIKKLNEQKKNLKVKKLIFTGFVLLRTKLATWRYQRVYKPINLTSTNTVSTPTESTRENASGDIAVCESEDQDVPPVIEDILEYLIQGLRDKTITIRWSAAKGIGRITARLPIDLADDVVGYVLNLFSGRESNSAWHGGCLALAELGTGFSLYFLV